MLDSRSGLVGPPGTKRAGIWDPIAKHISNPDIAPFRFLIRFKVWHSYLQTFVSVFLPCVRTITDRANHNWLLPVGPGCTEFEAVGSVEFNLPLRFSSIFGQPVRCWDLKGKRFWVSPRNRKLSFSLMAIPYIALGLLGANNTVEAMLHGVVSLQVEKP